MPRLPRRRWRRARRGGGRGGGHGCPRNPTGGECRAGPSAASSRCPLRPSPPASGAGPSPRAANQRPPLRPWRPGPAPPPATASPARGARDSGVYARRAGAGPAPRPRPMAAGLRASGAEPRRGATNGGAVRPAGRGRRVRRSAGRLASPRAMGRSGRPGQMRQLFSPPQSGPLQLMSSPCRTARPPQRPRCAAPPSPAAPVGGRGAPPGGAARWSPARRGASPCPPAGALPPAAARRAPRGGLPRARGRVLGTRSAGGRGGGAPCSAPSCCRCGTVQPLKIQPSHCSRRAPATATGTLPWHLLGFVVAVSEIEH